MLQWLTPPLTVISAFDEMVPGVLVGTKTDLGERRCVTFQAAQEIAQRLGFRYMEVSSVRIACVNDEAYRPLSSHARACLLQKQADNVQEPFFYLASLWHRLFYEKAEFLKAII